MEQGTKKARILVVEDDRSLARFLELELGHEGYAVETVGDGYRALVRATEEDWDLILLDIMLPGMDGFSVCRRIRERSSVPIIMLTARDAVNDRVQGLDAGADDYLCKPFATEELLARIRARLRRQKEDGPESDKVVVGDLEICPKTRTVTRGGQKIHLTKREFDLLHYLAVNAGVVLDRETILNRVWGFDYFGNTNVVDVYIRYLRAKIDDPFPKKLIHTVRGVGYVLREEEK
ncbi:response regulator transcription factor [Ammonifex thiophilus]|uniref:Stage 0 sporulation protein A homolog n=1 Tax=Ammonifex thiophilus TaxID=444093 RepID=A0A3D8P6Q4_9THEO|nr:response regulator transcription factor [Ammonifex thiophilus]RDV84034.1 DNA-binding response regulator [Ammonifex thiophilus]